MATIDRNLLLGLADRDKDGNADPSVMDMAINWAERTIDGKLSARYTVPLATNYNSVPGTIRQMTLDLTRWRLLKGTLQPEGFANNISDAWEADYNNAMGMLSNYATGPAKIPALTPTGQKPVLSVGLSGDNVEKTFTETRVNVGGGVIDTGETGTMDIW